MSGAWSAGSALTKSLTDTATATEAAFRTIGSKRSDTQAVADEISKAPSKKPADAVTPADATAKSIRATRQDQNVVIDSSAQSGELADTVGLAKADGMSLAMTQASTVGVRGLTDTVSALDDLTFSGARSAALADSVTFGETPVITFRLALADSVLPVDQEAVATESLQIVPVDPVTLTLTPLE